MPDSKRSSSIWRAKGSRRGEFGLITLEWLLIFGAIAGIAASSVLAVQIVIDDSTDLPDRPDVRVVDAEIAAATVASEATEVMEDNSFNYTDPVDAGFRADCEEVANEYSDVMDPIDFVWVSPNLSADPPTRAQCNLTRV